MNKDFSTNPMAHDKKLLVMNLDELIPHPKNLTYFPVIPEAFEVLKTSIANSGLINEILVNHTTKHIIAGNKRYQALKDLGVTQARCAVISIPKDDEIHFLIEDNAIMTHYDPHHGIRMVKWLRDTYKWDKDKRAGEKAEGLEDGETPRDAISRILNVTSKFVTMADKFEELGDAEKAAIQNWMKAYFKNNNRKPSMEKISLAIEGIPTVLTGNEAAGIVKAMNHMVDEKSYKALQEEILKLKGSKLLGEMLKDINKIYKSYVDDIGQSPIDAKGDAKIKNTVLELYGKIQNIEERLYAQFPFVDDTVKTDSTETKPKKASKPAAKK